MPKKIERRQSSIHGNGVFATAAIAKGERVVRYKGEVRKHADVDADYAGHDETGHTFLFSLNDEWVIDANRDGNVARWINHSCAPNCEAIQEENAKGKKHKDKVYIHALRDIAAGEELSYNYGIVIDEPYTPALKKLWECRCGSSKCTGTMLQPKDEPKPEKTSKAAKADKAGKPEKAPPPKKTRQPKVAGKRKRAPSAK